MRKKRSVNVVASPSAIRDGAMLLVLLSVFGYGQPPAAGNLFLKAALVLTPDFCKSQKKQGDKFWTGVETMELGKAACSELEPVLRNGFKSLTRLTEPPPPGSEYQVVLFPRFADASATRPTKITIFNRPTKVLDVELEWTVKDQSGKTLWMGTVQGTAEHRLGTTRKMKRIVNDMTNAAMKEAGEKSIAAMTSAAELKTLNQ